MDGFIMVLTAVLINWAAAWSAGAARAAHSSICRGGRLSTACKARELGVTGSRLVLVEENDGMPSAMCKAALAGTGCAGSRMRRNHRLLEA